MDRMTQKMSESGKQPDRPLEKKEPLRQRMLGSFKRVAGKVTDHFRKHPHHPSATAR